MTLGRSWLALTIPLALLAGALLVVTATSLVRRVRGSVVASVPLLPRRVEHQVAVAHAGELALSLEGRLLARLPAPLTVALTSADGRPVALRPSLARTRVSSGTRARLELYTLTLPAPGTYVLHVGGELPDDSDGAIVLTRPIGVALVGHVVALVLLGVALIGSIVVSALAVRRAP